jgi:hypothetical protein
MTMGVASIQSRFRKLPDSELLEVIFTLTSDQSTNAIDLSLYGFNNYATNPILSVEEFSGIPGTWANTITTSTATLSGLKLTINNSATRMIRVTGR